MQGRNGSPGPPKFPAHLRAQFLLIICEGETFADKEFQWPTSRFTTLRRRARPSRSGCWRSRRAIRHQAPQAERRREPQARLSGGQPDGQGAGAPARRRNHHRGRRRSALTSPTNFPREARTCPVGDPRRGAYLKWLFFGPSCVRAGGDGARVAAQGAGRRALARLRRLRYRCRRAGKGRRRRKGHSSWASSSRPPMW